MRKYNTKTDQTFKLPQKPNRNSCGPNDWTHLTETRNVYVTKTIKKLETEANMEKKKHQRNYR